MRSPRRTGCLGAAVCLLALAFAPMALAAPASMSHDEFCEPAPIPADEPGPLVGIEAESASVEAGGLIYARVENRSDERIEFGAEYHVQRFTGGMWRRAPGGPRGPFIQIAFLLQAGRSGSCVRYPVPEGAPPGRYRFSRDLIVGSGPARPYYAPFRVTR